MITLIILLLISVIGNLILAAINYLRKGMMDALWEYSQNIEKLYMEDKNDNN